MKNTPWYDDEIWERATFWLSIRLAILALCLLVGSAMGAGCGCARDAMRPSSTREATTQELQSTVTLVHATSQWVGLTNGHYVIVHQPYCNAFALERRPTTPSAPGSPTLLITAAHCLEHAALTVGDRASYREPSGWGLGVALVTLVDGGRDYAELTLTDGHALVPLQAGDPPREGHALSSPSSYFGETTHGRVYAVGGDYFAFDGAIERGWSGSPVLDVYGRAVGVVTKCVLDDEGRLCADGVIAGAL